MLRRLYLITSLMALAVTLAGLMPPATALPDLPDCARFAGKDGMTTYQNTLLLTYLKAVGNMGQVIYAVSTDNGISFINTILDSDTLADYVSAPVINISNGVVTIAFSKDGKTLSKTKSLNTTDFSDEPATIADYPDPIPLLRYNNNYGLEAVTYQADSLSVVNDTSVSYSSMSTEETPVYYSGPSEYWSKIHCNDDIWIKQEGGGTNNGWPIFHAEVTTGGTIHYLSPNPPVEQIFLNGYQEYTPNASINEDLIAQLRNYGTSIGEAEHYSEKIYFVEVNGNTYTSRIGYILERRDTTDVWTHYPPRSGSYLFHNRFSNYDTIWVNGASGINQGMTMVYGKLWIRGNFAGKQIWGATEDISIIGDISLYGTPIGQAPDEIGTPTENQTDFVALVSEKNINIKYGYKDPYDSLRVYPNMGDTYIYASMFALGNGNGNPTGDGNISFEYQHPHPSVPDMYLNGALYCNIDLHRYRYSQNGADSWPSEIDYPLYNPLWPESHPYLERGNLHIYGNMYQRRQGFLHLPLSQNDNPLQAWDIEHLQYGGNSGMAVYDSILGVTMQAVNYPGTDGDGIGYRKVLMHGDRRLENVSYLGLLSANSIVVSGYVNSNNLWNFKYSLFGNEPQRCKTSYLMDIAFNNKIISFNHDYTGLEATILPNGDIRQISGNNHYSSMVRHYSLTGDTLNVFLIDTEQHTYELLFTQPTNNSLSYLSTSQLFLEAMQPDGRIFFYHHDQNAINPFELYYTWEPQIPGLNVNSIDNAESYLVTLGNQDSLLAFIFIRNTGESTGTFYRAQGSIENVLNQDDTLPAILELTVYPNPFRQILSIRVSTDKQARADIAIYNLKGQKVVDLGKDVFLSKGVSNLEWNGRDANGNEVCSGLYFMHSKVGNKTSLLKVLKIK